MTESRQHGKRKIRSNREGKKKEKKEEEDKESKTGGNGADKNAGRRHQGNLPGETCLGRTEEQIQTAVTDQCLGRETLLVTTLEKYGYS